MIFFSILVLFVVQSTWGYLEESYYPVDNTDSYVYTDDLPDNENDVSLQRRNGNNFLRFGRNEKRYDEYDELTDDFTRPTRSGKIEKNDHFIRFGRSKQDFLRFGRDQHRVQRDRSNYLRFGRSVSEPDQKKRNKREATSTYQEEIKRGASNFLRFGRNTNFMRFGRNPASLMTLPTSETENHQTYQINDLLSKIKQINESPLIHLLNELAISFREENRKCNS